MMGMVRQQPQPTESFYDPELKLKFCLYRPNTLVREVTWEGEKAIPKWILLYEDDDNLVVIREYYFEDEARQGFFLVKNGIEWEIVQDWTHGKIEHDGDPLPKYRRKIR